MKVILRYKNCQPRRGQPTWPIQHSRPALKEASFRQAQSVLQRRLREIQNDWWELLARKTQLCADYGDYGGFYETLKAVFGPTHQVQSPLRSSNGQELLTDKASILTPLSEHFQTLFSANHAVQDMEILGIPHLPIKGELDKPPTLEETIKAI